MYTMLATGDLMLQAPIVRADAVGMQRVFDVFRTADHVFVNLEVVLTSRSDSADKLVCLRADPSLATQLVEVGVKIVTVANNHALDYGLPGLYDSLSALEKVGLSHVGAGRDIQAAYRPVVLSTGNLRVAFLGMACTLPNGCGAGVGRGGIAPVRILSRFIVDPVTIDEDPGMAPFVETVTMPGDTERAAEAVRRAKEAADIVVIGIHWGVPNGWVAEFQSEVATYQQPLGHALIDAGGDVIIGHHPHVLHGIEVYRGRPIFYSLGNFLFHSLLEEQPSVDRPYPAYLWDSLRSERNRYGGIARLSWEEPGRGPSRVEVWPVWLDEAGEPALPSTEQAQRAIVEIAQHSEQFGTRIRPLEMPHGHVAVLQA